MVSGSVWYKIDRNYVDLDVQRINYLDFANGFRQSLIELQYVFDKIKIDTSD